MAKPIDEPRDNVRGTLADPREGVNPKDLIGATKAPLGLVPPALLIETAPVMALGAKKYGPYNWRSQPVKLSIYLDAIERHLLAVRDGQWLDPESRRPHVAHISAGAGIVLDAAATDNLINDLPPKGPAAKLLERLADPEDKPGLRDLMTGPTSGRLDVASPNVRPVAREFGGPSRSVKGQADFVEPWENLPAPEDKLPLEDDSLPLVPTVFPRRDADEPSSKRRGTTSKGAP